MKSLRLFILSLALFMFGAETYSQVAYPISGKVRNAEGKELLSGATVLLKNEEDKIAGFAVTEDGLFTVKVPRGRYILKISFQGFQTYTEEIRVYRDQYLGLIDMQPGSDSLSEVKVERKTPQATVSGDTTTYSSKAFKTNENASSKDLVEKLPGVQNTNGELKAQGEKVQQVLVDGKPFFSTDPNATLNTLPAEVVDKIQIFDDQSEQSKASGIDDGTRIKTINLVTKINMRSGEFGKVYGGYGTDDRYAAGASYNIFRGDRRISFLGQANNINQQNFSSEDLLGVVGDNSGARRRGGRGPGGGRPAFLSGFSASGSANDFSVSQQSGITETQAGGINYQDVLSEKLEVNASYFYNKGENLTEQDLYQEYYLPESTQAYQEIDSTTSTNINHRVNGRLVYRFSPKASIFILPSATFQSNEALSIANARTTVGQVETNNLQNYISDLQGLNWNNNLMFRLNGEKRGRSLFTQVKIGNNAQLGDQELDIFKSGEFGTEVLEQISSLNSRELSWVGGFMYSEPLGEKGLGALISYDITNTTNNLDLLTQNVNIVGITADSLLSSLFSNTWIQQSAGFGIRKFGRGGGFVVRVAYQHLSLNNETQLPGSFELDKSFHNILPFALYRKRFKDRSAFFAMYRTYTVNPTADQLSPRTDNTNPLQLSTGNADLDVQYGHWIRAKYNKANTKNGTVFYAMVNGGFSNSYISQSTFTAAVDTIINGYLLRKGGQITAPINLRGQMNLNSFITYGFPLKALKSNINFNLSGGLSRFPNRINDVNTFTLNQNMNLGTVISSNISKYHDFTISSEGSYNISTNSENTSLDQTYWVQNSQVKYTWVSKVGFTFRTQVSHQIFLGIDGLDENEILLWNMGFGYQLFENKRGEISLNVFDLLNRNTALSQRFTANTYEEVLTNALTRYVMLTFTYNIRRFKTDAEEDVQ
jgi:hypothetical protein